MVKGHGFKSHRARSCLYVYDCVFREIFFYGFVVYNVALSEWEEFFKKLRKRLKSFDDFSKDFEDIEKEIEKHHQSIIKELEKKSPNARIRKQIRNNNSSSPLGPFVYGYSITIGPDKKPKIREFGNVKPSSKGKISVEVVKKREPLVDIIEGKNKIKIVAEIPGVSKKDINLDINDRQLKITTNSEKKYHKVINFSNYVDPSSAKAIYNNGILEITLLKKDNSRKDKKINIE